MSKREGLAISELLELYRKMVLIRRFEERIEKLFKENLITGTAHLCIGQEAVAVGACSVLKTQDLVVSNHRGHGHLLAKGGDPKRLMAELFGKVTGFCRGKGGTQHLCALAIGFLGTNGITGGGIPIATGAALTTKIKKIDRAVVCFFGDGASNQGTFHESLNMASLWNLPIVYLCENNLYGMSYHVRYSTSVNDIYIRAKGYSMESMLVDGMDVLSVREAMLKAIDYVKRSSKPILIEAKTYRFCGHSKSDMLCYRTREEEGEWLKKDPIIKFKDDLLKNGVTEEQLGRIKDDIGRQIDESVDFAKKSPEPTDQLVKEGIFADG